MENKQVGCSRALWKSYWKSFSCLDVYKYYGRQKDKST
jgi:hypothetical protein